MPRIVCFTCGRQVYTTVSFESLMAEERRCPRCGAYMHVERREAERRQAIRRQNPRDDPGPPTAAEGEAAEATGGERRQTDRRTTRRRHDPERRDRPGTGPDSVGWQD
jgi:DNA-directed RNA polymerase subunit RPC12/RpoP